MSWKFLIIFPHDSYFVGDIRESNSEEGIKKFKCFTELTKDGEEIFEYHFFSFLIFLEETSTIFDDELDIKLIIFGLFFHN